MTDKPITATEILASRIRHAEYCAKVDADIRRKMQPAMDALGRKLLDCISEFYKTQRPVTKDEADAMPDNNWKLYQ